MDVGVRAKHDSIEGGGTSSRMSECRTMQELLSRAKQDARPDEARAELATWQECYREVAYTEERNLISFGIWSQHCLEIPSSGS
jgi:hypothetical protein